MKPPYYFIGRLYLNGDDMKHSRLPLIISLIAILFSLILLTGCDIDFTKGSNMALIVGAIVGGILGWLLVGVKWGAEYRDVGGGWFEVTEKEGCFKVMFLAIFWGVIGAAIGAAAGYALAHYEVISC